MVLIRMWLLLVVVFMVLVIRFVRVVWSCIVLVFIFGRLGVRWVFSVIVGG